MKTTLEFKYFYNKCHSIIAKEQFYTKNLSNSEKIEYFRNKIKKTTLNDYFGIGQIPCEIALSIESKTNFVKLSVDNMIKNLIEHPEITLIEYQNLNLYIKKANHILKKNNKNLIYFKIDKNIYQFVIKRTKSYDELFLTTFHRASIKQFSKDINRYTSIKKDSSDYEDSKYPSVT